MRLIEHTNAYATLANNGKFVPYNPILKIEDSQGHVLYDATKTNPLDKANQAIGAGYAYQLTSILTDNETRSMIFGQNNLFGNTQSQLGRPTAAKSGTTDGWKDIWTMGYTTDVAIGVWVGNTSRRDVAATVAGVRRHPGRRPDLAEDDVRDPRPAWSTLLNGPDGNPMPENFPRPSEVYDGTVCASTGNQATPGFESKKELLVRGGGPYLACDQLSAEQSAELKAATDALRTGAKWTNGAQDKIRRYQSAVNGNGDSITSYDSSGNNSDNFNNDDEQPIEPLNP